MTDTESRVKALPAAHALPIGDVREADRNPRKIPDRAVELVALSIQRFGWKQPLVVDRDGVLVAGHTRHRAARLLKLTHVPAIIADDLTPEEVQAYRIADNRTSDFTTWDFPELAQQLQDLPDEFAEILALADWETAAAELDQAGSSTRDDDLPGGVFSALHEGFAVNVRFYTKEDALAAEQTIIDLPGAFDVRHNF